jgi:hypothetical protein
MRAALSAIAYAGAPSFVPPDCTGRMFMQNSPDPQKSCHFDLTQGNFNADAIASAIANVRGRVLGCTFELPTPMQAGMVVDRSLVNVRYMLEGRTYAPPRRKDRANACLNSGCWDYTPDGKVELLGQACDDVKGAANVKVQIVVGCATVFG